MKILEIREEPLEELREHFDTVDTYSPEKVAPEVVGRKTDLRIDGKPVENWDGVYAEIPPENAVFGRIMLEIINEKRIPVNQTSTGFFTAAKKNYLYSVLHQKNIKCPKTVTLSSGKAARNVEKLLRGPLIARRFQEFREVERGKLEEVSNIEEFCEGIEYPRNTVIFQEYHDGDKYRCLVVGDDIITLKDDSEGWKTSSENLSYSNISSEKKELVRNTVDMLGMPMAEVTISGEHVIDVDPVPDIEMFSEVSGKNLFKSVAELLREMEV